MPLTLNGTTGIAGVDGSAGTPALRGTDTNTGIVFGSDTLSLATGGNSAALTVDANSNVTFPATTVMGSSFLRNRIINGSMEIDQRNNFASQTITAGAALAYTVDRWYAYCTGANVTGQGVAGTGSDQRTYRFTGATSNTFVGFGQRIEQNNSYDLSDQNVTISCVMSASTNTTITWYLYTPTTTADTFGTIASPTVTQVATGTFSVTTTKTTFSATITAAQMASVNKGLELRLVAASGLGNGVTWTIDNTQLEVGSVATPFERRQYGQELALCQRYFAKVNALASTTARLGTITYPVTMRATPTITQTFDSGTGATYSALGSLATAMFQDTAHSAAATATVSITAEL